MTWEVIAILARLAPGRLNSCAGTTMRTDTAASATLPLASVIAARIRPPWRLATRCTSRLASATQRGGQDPHATGRPSAQSPSTPNATRSSEPIRNHSLGSRWLHELGDNHLDARRNVPPFLTASFDTGRIRLAAAVAMALVEGAVATGYLHALVGLPLWAVPAAARHSENGFGAGRNWQPDLACLPQAPQTTAA